MHNVGLKLGTPRSRVDTLLTEPARHPRPKFLKKKNNIWASE